jgi:hypothetical protein
MSSYRSDFHKSGSISGLFKLLNNNEAFCVSVEEENICKYCDYSKRNYFAECLVSIELNINTKI